MKPEEFKDCTRRFALRTVRLVQALPQKGVGRQIGEQIFRCSTSVAANYRAACRARSPKDFVAKLKIVEEECDETLYWMELLVDSEQVKKSLLKDLYGEGAEILAMVVASLKTVRSRTPNRQSSIVNRQS